MITKHTDIYYTNDEIPKGGIPFFERRFSTEAEALEDERVKKNNPYRVKTIHKSVKLQQNSNTLDFSNVKTNGIVALDSYGEPMLPVQHDTVYLFKDMIKNMQLLIDEFGENVGTCRQHRGTGYYADAIVILEKKT